MQVVARRVARGAVGGGPPAAPICFSMSMIYISTAYWLALRNREDIWRRGFPCIRHDMPEAYYKCLLQLPEAPSELVNRPDLGSLRSQDFQRLLRGGSLTAGALLGAQESQEGEPVAALDDEMGDVEPVEPDSLPPGVAGLGAAVPSFPLAPPSVRIGRYSVWFDRASHRSAIQRGYVQCLRHEDCFKYRQVTQDDRWQRTASWLTVWLSLGQDLATKEEHAEQEPWDPDVDRVLGQWMGSAGKKARLLAGQQLGSGFGTRASGPVLWGTAWLQAPACCTHVLCEREAGGHLWMLARLLPWMLRFWFWLLV